MKNTSSFIYSPVKRFRV